MFGQHPSSEEPRSKPQTGFLKTSQRAVGVSAYPSPTVARILISEDNPNICAIYRKLLYGYGFELSFVKNGDGEETLKLAKQLQPRLLITDLHKPSIDGYTLCQALRRDPLTQHIPTLMVTTADAWYQRPQLSAIDDYLVKPFTMETLLYRVVALLALDRSEHQRLVEYALHLAAFAGLRPVTSFADFHQLALQLPQITARPDWAALRLNIENFGTLLHSYGRSEAEGIFGRLAGIVQRASHPQLTLTHTGFEAAITVIGPAELVDRVAFTVTKQLASFQIGSYSPIDSPQPWITFSRTDSTIGTNIDLLTLREAFQ